jgi:lipopolysaccharide transport system permease protein
VSSGDGAALTEKPQAQGVPPRIPVKVIRAQRHGLLSLASWREIWDYRQLLFLFCWREFRSRYKQTALGIGWAVLQPVLTMVVFSVLLGRIAGLEAGHGIPYPLFVFSGTLAWQIVQSGITRSATSLVDNAPLITKVYFPRVYLPVSPLTVAVVDFCLAFLVLLGFYAYFGVLPPARIVLLPLIVVLLVVSALGVALWLSAINVDARDVKHATPFMAQMWMFLTPVVYPRAKVPEEWLWLYDLNPMVALIEAVRWSLLATWPAPALSTVLSSVAVMLLIFASGFVFFQLRVRTIADRV